MDSSSEGVVTPRRTRRFRWGTAALLAAFVAYAVLLAAHVGAYAGGSDAAGYMNNVKLILSGQLRIPQRAIEGLPPDTMPYFTYVPLGFTATGQGEMVPTYPVGISLLMAALSVLTTPAAGPPIAVWLHAVFGVVLVYAFARRLDFSRASSALGALVLGGCPLYLFNSLEVLSDSPALVWTTAAVYCAWRGRERPLWAIGAGAAMAMAVLVRPSNLLVIFPVAVCLGFSAQRWLGLIVGGLPGAAFLALYNVRLYGEVLTTGYGDVSKSFSPAFILPSLANCAQWVPILLTPGVLLALVLPFRHRREDTRLVVVLVTWILVFTGFYAAYYFTSETWWSLRFILPAFPALILAMLVVGRTFARSWSPRLAAAATILAFCGVLGWDAYWVVEKAALETPEGERAYVDAANWARVHLPKRSVIACMQTSGALLYYTDFILLRYDFARGPEVVKRIDDACAAARRPIYAALYEYETKPALETQLAGKWTQVGTTRNVTFWRRDAPEPAPIAAFPWRELSTSQIAGKTVTVETGPGWYGAEEARRHRWSWAAQRATLRIETTPAQDCRVELNFLMRGFVPATVTISQNGSIIHREACGTARKSTGVFVEVRDGSAELEFVSDTPATKESDAPDARLLAFAIYDVRAHQISPR